MAIVASETRGNPWTPTPWVSMGFHILWKHMETYGHLYGNPWQLLHRKLVEIHGHHTNGFPWVSTSSGNPRKLMHRKPMSHGNPWKPTDSYGNHWKHLAPVHTYGKIWKPVETRGKLFGYLGQHVVIHGNLWKQYGAV